MRAIFSPLLWNPPAVLRLFIDAVAVQGVFFFLANFLLSTRLCNRYVFRKPSPSHQHHWDRVSLAVTRRIFAWRSAWTSPLAGLFAELSAWRRHKEEKSVRASFIGTEPKVFRFKELFPPPPEPVFSWIKYFFMPPQTSAANQQKMKQKTNKTSQTESWMKEKPCWSVSSGAGCRSRRGTWQNNGTATSAWTEIFHVLWFFQIRIKCNHLFLSINQS